MAAMTLEAVHLAHGFADAVPEMAVPTHATIPPDPRLLILNAGLASELGLDATFLRSEAGVALLTGTGLPDEAVPVAQAYSGHQFGGFSPHLGDGRALLLGEIVDRQGNVRDLHLKGSGRTRFARAGDGLAAVGPMLREYIVSESMHALGVPTTRSLAVVATGRTVDRELPLPGAVLARIASSHLRVGSCQYARGSTDDLDLLRRLVDLAIVRHHPDAAASDNRFVAFFRAVVRAQADLVASWMLIGFVHGVMNTDNMTLSGETIDYGPCAFLDAYDPSSVYSSIDRNGRYAYGNQPAIAEWNLARLAESLLPLFDDDQGAGVAIAQEVLGEFAPRYNATWSSGMRAKLGLDESCDLEVAASLAHDLLALLHLQRSDYTSTFRALAAATRGDMTQARTVLGATPDADAWIARWLEQGPDATAMDAVNPVYIPRNHLVEEVLASAADGDLEPLKVFLQVLTDPFDERIGFERYAAPAPEAFGAYRTFCGT